MVGVTLRLRRFDIGQHAVDHAIDDWPDEARSLG
jgi:hypothetical protein